MSAKFLTSILVLTLGISISAVIANNAVFAQEAEANIQYPVQELGGCTSKQACKSYCDKPENIDACVSFAEKNGLMKQDEIAMAKKFAEAGAEGPGGCTSRDSCDAYCSDMANMDECVSFAEKTGMMSGKELDEAKKIQAALKRGVKAPACGNKKACDSYCQSADHMEECITFAQEAGFIQGQELEESKKVLQAIKQGVKLPACQGKEQCDAYCSEESHFEECTNFAVAAGFMDAKDAEMARKTGGKGPGGCKTKEQCDAFCNDPANEETCFKFGIENGMIPQEDLKKMEDGKQQMRDALTQAPPEVLGCLSSSIGSDKFEQMKSGSGMLSRDIGEKMRTCFESMMPKDQQGMMRRPGDGDQVRQGQEGMMPDGFVRPAEMMRPDGVGMPPCSSPEECQKMFGNGQVPTQEMMEQFRDMKPGEARPPMMYGQEGQIQRQNMEGLYKEQAPEGFQKPQDGMGMTNTPGENFVPQGIDMTQSYQDVMQGFQRQIQMPAPNTGFGPNNMQQQVPGPMMQQQTQEIMRGEFMPQQMQGGYVPEIMMQPQPASGGEFMQPMTQQPQQQMGPGPESSGGVQMPPLPDMQQTAPQPPSSGITPVNLFGQLMQAFQGILAR